MVSAYLISLIFGYLFSDRSPPNSSAVGGSTPLCALTMSAHFCQQENLILGSVGSNSWRGSLQEHHEQKEIQIEDPLMKMDSYMGTEHKIVSIFF